MGLECVIEVGKEIGLEQVRDKKAEIGDSVYLWHTLFTSVRLSAAFACSFQYL